MYQALQSFHSLQPLHFACSHTTLFVFCSLLISLILPARIHFISQRGNFIDPTERQSQFNGELGKAPLAKCLCTFPLPISHLLLTALTVDLVVSLYTNREDARTEIKIILFFTLDF